MAPVSIRTLLPLFLLAQPSSSFLPSSVLLLPKQQQSQLAGFTGGLRHRCSVARKGSVSSDDGGRNGGGAGGGKGKGAEDRAWAGGGPPAEPTVLETSPEEVLDYVTEQGISAATHFWMELRGNMYVEWLDRVKEGGVSVEDLGWKGFLWSALNQPLEEIVVKKLVKFPRGGSGTNPYLKARQPVSFTEVLDPKVVVQRLMEVRSQVASELIEDLSNVARENELLQTYLKRALETPSEARRLRLAQYTPTIEDGTPARYETYESMLKKITNTALANLEIRLKQRGDKHILRWLGRFDPAQLQGSGNELVEALMTRKQTTVNDMPIEPVKVAAELMKLREVVAARMIFELENVPEHHERIYAALRKREGGAAPTA